MIKPDAYTNTGKIIDAIYQNGFVISKLKMSKFNSNSVASFYGEHKGKPFYDGLSSFIQGDVVTGMELVASNAVDKWRQLIGPTNSLQAKQSAPNSLRAIFGTDNTRNAVHGSDSGPSWKREMDFYFSGNMKPPAFFTSCTTCVIKPHAVANGDAGKIIDIIL